MTRYAAFLRAVNLGATRKLPMARVRELLPEALGYADVSTYIASGNILFTADDAGTDADAAGHASAIAKVLREEAGFDVPTAVYTSTTLATVLDEEPYDPAVPKHVNVILVQGTLDAKTRVAVEALADKAADGEGVTAGERAIYLHLPHSVHASKLAAAAGRATPLGMARNLATVRKVAELLG